MDELLSYEKVLFKVDINKDGAYIIELEFIKSTKLLSLPKTILKIKIHPFPISEITPIFPPNKLTKF